MFQTFHTPSFGDEDFDIPTIHPHSHQQQQQQHQQHDSMQGYGQPQVYFDHSISVEKKKFSINLQTQYILLRDILIHHQISIYERIFYANSRHYSHTKYFVCVQSVKVSKKDFF